MLRHWGCLYEGKLWLRKWSISGFLDQFGKARNFTGACAFMQNAFFHGFVNGCLSGFEIGADRITGIRSHSLANPLYDGFDSALDRPVAQATNFILAGAFEC
jgi:hypothetical protein